MTPSSLDLAKDHHRAGRLDLAEPIYRELLATDPDHPEALALLGMLYVQTNRHADAEPILRRATSVNPSSPESHFNLGLALSATNNWIDAAEAFSKSISLRPEYAAAHNGLGNALRNLGKIDDAITAHRKAVTLQDTSPGFWNNLGIALQSADKYPEAIDAYRRVIALNPNYADGWCNLSNALWRIHGYEEAAEASRRALALREDFPDALGNLGNALQSLGEYSAARAAFERALALRPDAANLHWNYSLLLLLLGDWPRAWTEYEWRRRVPEFQPTIPKFNRPMWDGEPLNGKRILIHAEQGFGDTIHFARYLPVVISRGGKVILHCQPPLTRLMNSIPEIETIIPQGDPIPDFDLHCPLLSLPHVLSTPDPYWTGPYLRASAGKKSEGKLNIGLIWSGRTHLPGRSIPLALLAPLADPRVQFHSLQVEEGLREAQSPPPGMNLINAGSKLRDFADTAALMNQLDLIISIDTAAAQLAGALGRPIWVFLKFVPDWRWSLDRSESPWYPTARLFRQKTRDDWNSPIHQAAIELKKMLDAKKS
jgi:tetratricopeptide (TPR) repeat protein